VYSNPKVGRLLAFLDDDLKLTSNNLLLIFTSDHGALLHDHGAKNALIFHFSCSPPIIQQIFLFLFCSSEIFGKVLMTTHPPAVWKIILTGIVFMFICLFAFSCLLF